MSRPISERAAVVQRRQTRHALRRAEARPQQLGDRAVGDGALTGIAPGRQDDARRFDATVPAAASARRVLPMPASPSSSTRRPSVAASRQEATIAASSASRPTSGTSPRPALGVAVRAAARGRDVSNGRPVRERRLQPALTDRVVQLGRSRAAAPRRARDRTARRATDTGGSRPPGRRTVRAGP